jgi:hypothetical protein
LQAGAPGPASPAGFTGDDRFLSQYFRFELLSRLPPPEAAFLKYTSVLDRMCGGLCDAVLETTRSAHTLESLEHRNCFVVPLDRRAEWYRYGRADRGCAGAAPPPGRHLRFGGCVGDEPVSSRSEAIERAVQVGLLESSVYPAGANLTPEG